MSEPSQSRVGADVCVFDFDEESPGSAQPRTSRTTSPGLAQSGPAQPGPARPNQPDPGPACQDQPRRTWPTQPGTNPAGWLRRPALFARQICSICLIIALLNLMLLGRDCREGLQAQCRGTGLEEREAGSGLKALGCGLIMHVAIFQHFAGALFGASVCAHYYRGGGPPNLSLIAISLPRFSPRYSISRPERYRRAMQKQRTSAAKSAASTLSFFESLSGLRH